MPQVVHDIHVYRLPNDHWNIDKVVVEYQSINQSTIWSSCKDKKCVLQCCIFVQKTFYYWCKMKNVSSTCKTGLLQVKMSLNMFILCGMKTAVYQQLSLIPVVFE